MVTRTGPLRPLADPAHTDAVLAQMQRWLDRAVIGLNLCPFARGVQARCQIRWVVSAADSAEAVLEELGQELTLLDQSDPLQHETTLLVLPNALSDFLDFNDFLDDADAAVEALELEGEIQVASFHPQYQFAGSSPDDIDNYTNRAPYPTLHLLRESSLSQAIEGHGDPEMIYAANIQRLRQLGLPGWQALFKDN